MSSLRILLLSLWVVGSALAAEVTVTPPPETGEFKAAPGVEVVQASCLTCHSSEYVTTQPPLPRAFWEANVKKMIERFAAPVPQEQVPAIVDYLVATYGAPPKPAK
jgi:sulfite dehydrogenase (cytochrome) subunit B